MHMRKYKFSSSFSFNDPNLIQALFLIESADMYDMCLKVFMNIYHTVLGLTWDGSKWSFVLSELFRSLDHRGPTPMILTGITMVNK